MKRQIYKVRGKKLYLYTLRRGDEFVIAVLSAMGKDEEKRLADFKERYATVEAAEAALEQKARQYSLVKAL